MKEYITLTVDGKSVKIEKGSTLLEAARKAGADIPTLCHDERVKPYGACGMCVVECKGSPKLMRSCAIEAADGMEIITESDRINRARRFSLEMCFRITPETAKPHVLSPALRAPTAKAMSGLSQTAKTHRLCR